MANIKLKDFPSHLKAKLDSAVKELTSSAEMVKIGNELKDGIYKRTKLGYGVDKSLGSQAKLKPLSESYKSQRKTMKLDATASPGRSNLTQTGEMLSDMVVKSTDKKTVITFGKQLSKDKVGWNEDMGRTFFNISKTQMSALVAKLQKRLLEILR